MDEAKAAKTAIVLMDFSVYIGCKKEGLLLSVALYEFSFKDLC